MSVDLPAAALVTRVPTGIDFLDRVLHGGQLPIGVHALLGTIGAGKTTLGTMIAVEGAIREQRRGQTGKWVFVTIDEPARNIWPRAVSHAAQIPLDAALAGVNQAATGRANRLPPDEQARCCAALATLANHFEVLDLSNAPFRGLAPFGSRSGPVHEIAASIAALPAPIAGIVIDYAGIAISRHLRALNLPEYQTSRYLQDFVAESRAALAQRFQCPVWLLHQLNARANQQSAGTSQHHRDAAGCRSFGAGLDMCITLGTVAPDSGCRLLRGTKVVSQSSLEEPLVLCFHSHGATLEEDRTHRVNLATRCIESAAVPAKFDHTTLSKLNRCRTE